MFDRNNYSLGNGSNEFTIDPLHVINLFQNFPLLSAFNHSIVQIRHLGQRMVAPNHHTLQSANWAAQLITNLGHGSVLIQTGQCSDIVRVDALAL